MAGYGSEIGFQAWLLARGHTLPAGAPVPAVLLVRATDYIDGEYGTRLCGDQTVDPLKTALENATYAAAWHEAQNPGSLSVSASAISTVKREKVGPLEVEYAAGSGDAISDATIRLSAVEGLLAPFLKGPEIAVFVV